MAGGKITRIIKGTNSIECEKWEVYTDNFSAYANKGSYFTADGGTNFGTPKDPPPPNKYFEKGWWTDKEDKPIKEAKILNVVRFHVQTQNIEKPEGKNITIAFYEHDYGIPIPLTFGLSGYSTDDHIRIMRGNNEITTMQLDKEGKGYIEISLDWALNNLFNEETLGFNEEGGDLELYFKCGYDDQKNVHLPDSFGDYLKVKRSEQNLFIQSACPGYPFPEIRTYSGDIVLFNEAIIEVDENNEALDPVKDYLLDDLKGKTLEKLGNEFDNIRRVIAVRQLNKGKLVTNQGTIHFRKKLYLSSNLTNLGEEVKIMKASNMGWRKDGKLVTTRGISQIDHFENIGFANKMLKVSKSLLNVLDFVDLIKYMSGNGKPDYLPTSFPPLDLIVELIAPLVLEQFKEMENEMVDSLLEQAKDKGVAGIKNFIGIPANVTDYNNPYKSDDDDKIYDFIEITQETYNKLMMGEFKTILDLQKSEYNEENIRNQKFHSGEIKILNNVKPFTILYKKEFDTSIKDDIILIETIFTNY